MVLRSIYCSHWELITSKETCNGKEKISPPLSSLTAKTFLHKNDVQKIETNKSMLSINAETCAILWFQCKRRTVLSKEVGYAYVASQGSGSQTLKVREKSN